MRCFLALLLAVTCVPVAAQDGSGGRALPEGRPTMTAERLVEGERIGLDGRLDEPVWQRAVPATDFIQRDPVYGGIPTERTEVRIVFDEGSLYMGVEAFDSEPDKLLGNTMKRDEFLSADDRFMWTMDTFLDQQTGYFFEMNRSGLMADALLVAGGGNERAWDGIWDAQVRRHEGGWTLEIEIPFRTLNFDPDAPAWGINFQRTVRRKNEENFWAGHERNQGLQRMSNAGLLLGITGVSQGKGLDVKPYAVTTSFEAPGTVPATEWTTEADMGLDVSYSITPSLKSNLTLNTDFAQTEVDQRLVNLTRFPLRYPEKRDFFLDGAPFFAFAADAVTPFFSRRIGLGSGGIPQTIDLGGKLTGQAGAQDLGFLHVRTGEDDDQIGEDFTVLRMKRRVLSQSYLGTFVSRRATRSAPLGAGDPPESRYTAGADFRLATSTFRGSQNLDFSGYFLWATDPDPSVSGDNLSFGGQLRYPNDPWSGALGFREVQPDHDPAIGFVPRRGFRGYTSEIGFGHRPANHRWIRQLNFGTNAEIITDMDSELVTRTVNLTVLGLDFHSQDNLGLEVTPSWERLERDFEIYDGVVLPEGAEYDFTRYRVRLGTANRRILSTSSSVEYGDFFSGQREEYGLNLGIRPRPGVRINLNNEWNRVHLPEGDFTTRVHRIVTDTQFSPWIYLVNNLQYDSVSESLGWQFRLRWTLNPGNDLYVVYTHNWRDDVLLERFATQDRRAAAKFVYTFRW